MPDDSSLREKVREAMETGGLPNRLPDQLLGGAPTGERCAVCGESTNGGIEMELVFSDGDATGRKSYFAHPHCFAIFENEIQTRPERAPALPEKREDAQC
jgi:hypothetical protein